MDFIQLSYLCFYCYTLQEYGQNQKEEDDAEEEGNQFILVDAGGAERLVLGDVLGYVVEMKGLEVQGFLHQRYLFFKCQFFIGHTFFIKNYIF